MPLTLKIIAPTQLISGQLTEFTFDTLGGSIGRKPTNDFILLDPERFISSKHAIIEFNNDKFYITDASTNGVFINNCKTPLGLGNSAEIKQGDKISIGDFQLLTHIDLELFDSASPNNLPDHDFPQSLAHLSSKSPEQAPVNPHLFPDHNQPDYDEPATTPFFDSDIVDPLEILNGASPSSNGSDLPSLSVAEHLLDDVPSDVFFQHPHESIPEPAVINEPFSPPNIIPDDWQIMDDTNEPALKMTPATPHGSPREHTPQNKNTPTINDDDIFQHLDNNNAIKQQNDPRGNIDPPLAHNPKFKDTDSSTARENELLMSFLKGAGIEFHQLNNVDKEALMFRIGTLTRSSVEGLMVSLRARTTIKSSFRVSKTSIAPIENNPLKFLINTDEALITLLSDDKPGYMPAEEAVKECFNDLETHQLALMAGMQATIKAILTQFDPKNLEPNFKKQNKSSLIPGQRKAKNWDAYILFHAKISDKLGDDFQHVYGDEFAHAYEAQINKLR